MKQRLHQVCETHHHGLQACQEPGGIKDLCVRISWSDMHESVKRTRLPGSPLCNWTGQKGPGWDVALRAALLHLLSPTPPQGASSTVLWRPVACAGTGCLLAGGHLKGPSAFLQSSARRGPPALCSAVSRFTVERGPVCSEQHGQIRRM